jgi:hypothetical protein
MGKISYKMRKFFPSTSIILSDSQWVATFLWNFYMNHYFRFASQLVYSWMSMKVLLNHTLHLSLMRKKKCIPKSEN